MATPSDLTFRPSSLPREPQTTDPMERMVEVALIEAGVPFVTDYGGSSPHGLDFHVPHLDLAIEVKRFHSDRIGEQMKRAPNVIVAQGEPAVRVLAALIRGGGLSCASITR